MYRKINEDVVVSYVHGFEVKVNINRWNIQYKEGEKILKINIEPMSVPFGIAVYSETIDQWEPPHEERIGLADKERILKNIEGGLEVLGCPYQVC